MAIVITGGSKGIGREVALAFAAPGTSIIINYHADRAAADQTAEMLTERGARPFIIQADVGSPAGGQAIADTVSALGERVEMVVHCAVDAYGTSCLKADPHRFSEAVQRNSLSLLFLVQALDGFLDKGSVGPWAQRRCPHRWRPPGSGAGRPCRSPG